jgi:hypothetical protein
VTTPSSHPDLHACSLIDYREYFASLPPERLFDDALRAHHALWPAIEAAIRRHLLWAGPVVIEGWALLPDLVVTMTSPSLRAVWIEVPEATMRLRLEAEADFVRGAAHPSLLLERFVSRSTLMNRWLRVQALACGLPYVVLSGSGRRVKYRRAVSKRSGLPFAAAEHCASGETRRERRAPERRRSPHPLS